MLELRKILQILEAEAAIQVSCLPNGWQAQSGYQIPENGLTKYLRIEATEKTEVEAKQSREIFKAVTQKKENKFAFVLEKYTLWKLWE